VVSDQPLAEDTRVWIGRIEPGREADHARFVDWLNGHDAHAIFQRRRLTEYRLVEHDGTVTVIFKAPHTGDPRIMIDFLRYPGVWPEFWTFERAGGTDEDIRTGELRVHWRRADN
jgi:hypothetical protein